MNETHTLLLRVIGATLFSNELPTIETDQLLPLLKESKSQTAYLLAFSVLDNQLKEKLNSEQYTNCYEEFFRYAIAGTQNFSEHGELHELMTANDIHYVAMKGLASAMYYPEPSLRSMGDVDFLVYTEDLDRAGKHQIGRAHV